MLFGQGATTTSDRTVISAAATNAQATVFHQEAGFLSPTDFHPPLRIWIEIQPSTKRMGTSLGTLW